MSDLNRLLGQAEGVTAPDLWPDIRGRQPRQHPERRTGVALVALGLAAAGLVLAAMAFLGEPESRRRTPAATPLDVDPRVTAEIDLGQFPQEVAAGAGAVWVTVNEADPIERWYVARIDPATNEVTDEVQIQEPQDVAVGGGNVWVVGVDVDTGSAVFRLDATGRIVDSISLDCVRECYPSQIAATSDAVWVTASRAYPEWGEVIRIDPSSGTVTGRTRVPGDPRDLVVGEGGVWVYSLTHFTQQSVSGGTLYRLDPETSEVVATLLEGRIPPASGVNGPPVLAAGFGSVWSSVAPGKPIPLGDDETSIVQIDPSTNQLVGDPIPLGTLFLPFSDEAGGVWFRGGAEDAEPLISRLDPITRTVQDSFRINATVLDGAIDPGTSTMWLTTYEGAVLRVDLR
ncbi:MAG TPA: hypothetical protein VHH92_01825 [Actinomycetota bacterium]|nr:hypothetical protein [Actinomycetota bacterium]